MLRNSKIGGRLCRVLALFLAVLMCNVIVPTMPANAATTAASDQQLFEMSTRLDGNTAPINGTNSYPYYFVQNGLVYVEDNTVVPKSKYGNANAVAVFNTHYGVHVLNENGDIYMMINSQSLAEFSDSNGCVTTNSKLKSVLSPGEKILKTTGSFLGYANVLMTSKGGIIYESNRTNAFYEQPATSVFYKKTLLNANGEVADLIDMCAINPSRGYGSGNTYDYKNTVAALDKDGNVYILGNRNFGGNNNMTPKIYTKDYFGGYPIKNIVSSSSGCHENASPHEVGKFTALNSNGDIYEIGYIEQEGANTFYGGSTSKFTSWTKKTNSEINQHGNKVVWLWAGANLTIALKEDNTLWAWGEDFIGTNYIMGTTTGGIRWTRIPRQIFKTPTATEKVLHISQTSACTTTGCTHTGYVRLWTDSNIYYQGSNDYKHAMNGSTSFSGWTQNGTGRNTGPDSYYKQTNAWNSIVSGGYKGSNGELSQYFKNNMKEPWFYGPRLPKAGSIIVDVQDEFGNEVVESGKLAAGEKYTAKIYVNNVGKMNEFAIPLSFDNTRVRIATDPVDAFKAVSQLPEREAVPNLKLPTTYVRDKLTDGAWAKGSLINTCIGDINSQGYPIISNKYGYISIHGKAENGSDGNPPIVDKKSLMCEVDFYAIGNGSAKEVFTPFMCADPTQILAADELVDAAYTNGRYIYFVPEEVRDPITGNLVPYVSGNFAEILAPRLINEVTPITSGKVNPTINGAVPRNTSMKDTVNGTQYNLITYEIDRSLKTPVMFDIADLLPQTASYKKMLQWSFTVEGAGKVSDFVGINPSTIGLKNQMSVYQEIGGMMGGSAITGETIINLTIRNNEGVDLSKIVSNGKVVMPRICIKISKSAAPKGVSILEGDTVGSASKEDTSKPRVEPFNKKDEAFTLRPGFADYAPAGQTTKNADCTVEVHPTDANYDSRNNHEVIWTVIDSDNRDLTKDPLNPFNMQLVPKDGTSFMTFTVKRTYPKPVRIVCTSMYAENGKTAPTASWEVNVKLGAGEILVNPDFIVLYPNQQYNLATIKTTVLPADAVTKDVYLLDATPITNVTNLGIDINTGKMTAMQSGIELTQTEIDANGGYQNALIKNHANNAAILRYCVLGTSVTKDVLVYVVDMKSDVLNVRSINNKGSNADKLTVSLGTSKLGETTGIKVGDVIKIYDNAFNDVGGSPARIELGELTCVADPAQLGSGKVLITNISTPGGVGEVEINIKTSFPVTGANGYNPQGGAAGIRLKRVGSINGDDFQDMVPATYEAEGGVIAGNVKLYGRYNSTSHGGIEAYHANDSAVKTVTNASGKFVLDNWVQGRETNIVLHKQNYLDRIIKIGKDAKAQTGSVDPNTGGDMLVVSDEATPIYLWPGALTMPNQIKRSDAVNYVNEWYARRRSSAPDTFDLFNFDDNEDQDLINMTDLALMLKFVGYQTTNYAPWVIPGNLK